MSDSLIRIDPNLSAQHEVEIQKNFTAAVQMELGIQRSTVLMHEKRIEALLNQRRFDLELIEALKQRAFAAEAKLREVAEENFALKNPPAKQKRRVGGSE